MRVALRAAWLGVVLAGAFGVWAQTPSPTPQHPIDNKPEGPGQTCSYSGSASSDGTKTSTADCPKSAPSASQRFPFPGETSAPDMTTPSADAPAQRPASGDAGSAAKRLPFPGEPADSGSSPLKDAGSSGDSSSSSSSSSGSDGMPTNDAAGPCDPNDVNCDTPAAPKRNLHKKPDPPPLSVAQQVGEDLQVSSFYYNDKNYMGAYLRAKDAVTLAADDPDAQLALGMAARKLGKLDEAEKSFRESLKLDPTPKTKKAAAAALKEMTGGA